MSRGRNYISTKNMSHQDWLRHRKDGIGGSDCAAVLGFSKYRTPVDVWIDKTNPEDLKNIENMSMRIGHLSEQAVIKPIFVSQEEKKVLVDNKLRIHPEYEFIRGNLDGMIADCGDGLGTGVWEAKSTTGRVIDSVDGMYPIEYFLQCQHNMMVSGFKYAWLSIWIKDQDNVVNHYIPRDENLIGEIQAKEIEFWEKYVKGGQVPPPINTDDLDRIYKQSKPSKVEATVEIAKEVNELVGLKEQSKELDTKIGSAEFKIKEFMEDNEILEFSGEKLATFKTSQRFDEELFLKEKPKEAKKFKTAFDSKRLRIKHPGLYDAYKTPSGRRFTPTKDKVKL